MIKTVCIFASSCNYLDNSYYEAAQKTGKLLAQAKMDIVYGGSCLGMMWVCAKEAKNNNSKITGIMPQKLKQFDVDSDYCDEFYETPCMRTRKAKMDELSEAVIALPGGFGTLEELSEMIVQKQLGYNQKAIVILNTNGFYNKLLLFFDEIINQKFANKTAKGLYFVANTPEEAIDYLKHYTPDQHKMTKNDIYSR